MVGVGHPSRGETVECVCDRRRKVIDDVEDFCGAQGGDQGSGCQLNEGVDVDVTIGDAVDQHFVEVADPAVHGGTKHRRDGFDDPKATTAVSCPYPDSQFRAQA